MEKNRAVKACRNRKRRQTKIGRWKKPHYFMWFNGEDIVLYSKKTKKVKLKRRRRRRTRRTRRRKEEEEEEEEVEVEDISEKENELG